jgi:hypothetical protein
MGGRVRRAAVHHREADVEHPLGEEEKVDAVADLANRHRLQDVHACARGPGAHTMLSSARGERFA